MSHYNATPALPAPDSATISPPLMPEQPVSHASSDASSYFEQQQAGGPLPVPATVDAGSTTPGSDEVKDRAGPASFLASAMAHTGAPHQPQHGQAPGYQQQPYGQAPPPHGQQQPYGAPGGGAQQPGKDYGKMAMDALGMVAAAKYGHGSHGGGHKKHGSSAMLMSAGKMAYDMYNKKTKPQQPGQPGAPGAYGQQPPPPTGYYGQAPAPGAAAYGQPAPAAYGQPAPAAYGAPPPQQGYYGGAPPPPQQPHPSGGTGHFGLPGSHT